jgi:CHAT domain-containing protein
MDIPRLAYLSSCDAAVSRAVGLVDESINLAGACLLAGFPAVIGTMWYISDKHSADVAKNFYQRLMEGGNGIDVTKASEALHWAVRKLRDETRRVQGFSRSQPADPLRWGGYIHMGL